ncbi:hypothetical protein K440DRAFT_636596 [Wilcoxina mikolae CBS 423.85]|nr:hypothetical protein K440DRAFT_636596 [Wilcoxina mikolae CBS 423.85]
MDDHLLSLCLSSSSSSSEDESAATSRTSKLQQTESQFQHQKSIWNPLQPHTQHDKAAAEEQYYKRDYTGALETATRVLNEGVEMHPSERKELVALQEACKRRFAGLNTV